MIDTPPDTPPDAPPAPPRATPRPTRKSCHGLTREDDYDWLRSAVWQEVMRDPSRLEPDIRAYLEAENAYAETMLRPTQELQDRLVAEMRGRIKEDDSSVPAGDGPFAYYFRYRDGGQHPLICRTMRRGGPETVLIDGDALARGKAYFKLGVTRHAPDHARLAWSSDEAGAEFYTIRVRDMAATDPAGTDLAGSDLAGTDLADVIPDSSGAVVWSADGTAFFYVRLDESHRPSRVFRHRLNTPVDQDELIFRQDDPAFFMAIGETPSRRYAEISVHDHETSEIRLLELADNAARPFLVAPRRPSVQYDVADHPTLFGGGFLIHTNADGAEDFKICWAPAQTPDAAHWRDLVPHRPGVFILSMLVLADWLVRLEREDGLPRIVVRHLASGDEHAIAFQEEAYSLDLQRGYEFASDVLRFSYSSMTTPTEVWDYNLATRTRDLRKRLIIPSGHDPAAYVTRRIHARAPDGERVAISLLYRRDLPLDGTAPCLLYGYGAYGLSIPAAFSTQRLSLVDRGFVYAIAHIRGGTERGWRWYLNGKLDKKPNTFTDFIAAAAHLRAERICGRVVAQGGSAGGMLIGAVANLRPDLFDALIAEVPFVDVLNTMLDDTLPLTPPEWREWGNPLSDATAYQTIRSYSPYDNVRAQDYPPLLVLAGLTDPRVTYWEPAKWVARLRATKTDAHPLVLRTNMEAGHAGASGRFDRLKEVALTQAFALMCAGGKRSGGV